MELDFAGGLLGHANSTDSAPGTSGSGLTGVVGTQFVIGTRATRPPSTSALGLIFYASDQDVIYISIGTDWVRTGSKAGDIIWTNEAVARTGYVLLDGSAWPSTTGIYADLFAIWGGSNLPDVQARTFAAKGTHADMATLLGNEGVATVANRRQKHRTTDAKTTAIGSLAASHTLTLPDHTHPITDDSSRTFYIGNPGAENLSTTIDGSQGRSSNGVARADNPSTHPAITGSVTVTGAPTLGGSIGTNVSTDPIDTGAYVVLQPQAKL